MSPEPKTEPKDKDIRESATADVAASSPMQTTQSAHAVEVAGDAAPPRQVRTPSAQQAMFGEIADVCGFDVALLDERTKANVGTLAHAFIAAGVEPGMPTAAWTAERRRIADFANGRTISAPGVARLKTLVGAYRKALADGGGEVDGRYRDPITGRLVVNAWTAPR